jgi:hypothetical protein
MQDTLVDKLLPGLPRASAEQPGSALDKLQQADAWAAVRLARIRLVHE